jgi:hypothetical protein
MREHGLPSNAALETLIAVRTTRARVDLDVDDAAPDLGRKTP